MIELPEAMVIADQLNREVRGKRIRQGVFGRAPHKFAFASMTADGYATALAGKTAGEASARGSLILLALEPGFVLVLAGGGERTLLHRDESTLPKKHQLLLALEDGAFLSVSVQGWGSVLLLKQAEVGAHPWCGREGISPLSPDFTWERFQELFDHIENPKDSVKCFAISRPGIMGVGNGYLQDIFYLAKLHPRRRAVALSMKERRALYQAARRVLQKAVKLHGRDTERDLHNQPGRYRRLMDSEHVGQPCRDCGTAIQKIAFLGGACYFCPRCQPV